MKYFQTLITKQIPLIAILSLFSFGNCTKGPCFAKKPGYNFLMSASVFPESDSISINDTLWFEVSNPVMMLDLNTNTIINYSNAENLSIVARLIQLTGNSTFNAGFPQFEVLPIRGSMLSNTLDPTTLRAFSFHESQNEYSILVAFVPKSQGIFRLGFENAANVYQQHQTCLKSNFSFTLNNINSHTYLNNQNFNIVTTDSSKLYCFKVVP